MKNKRIRRGIALIVSVLVGLQLFPMSALAAMMVTEEIATNVSASGNNVVPDIVAEVVEERDEFSKVYLLEDGSFYSITSTAPVHKMEGGKWENIDESLERSENKTVESAEKALQEASSQYMQLLSVNSNSRTLSSQQETSSMIVNSLSCTELPGGGFVLGEGSMIVAKPTSINNYLKNNKVIIEANLAFTCVVGDDHVEGSTIDIYEANFVWDEESTEEEILNLFNDEMLPIDHISMDTDGTYYWDITDTYSRWDKEVTTNNGFFIHAGEESSLTISDMFISVRYEEVGEDDKDYSYHTFDMGRAGKVYINDFTNTMRLEQDILGIDGSVLPVEIKRYYNETEPSYMNTAGVGFRWNYESSLLHDNNIVTWKMFDGTIKRFVQSSPLETNGDYQKWIDVNCDVMSNEIAILWMKSTEIAAMNKNYENYYVELNENTYEFNSIGNLVKVMQGTENYIRINYDNNNSITSVVDSANHTFEFTYANNTTGYKHVVNVSAKNTTTGEPIQIMAVTGDATTVSVGFATSYDASTKITTNTITYSDEKTVVYKFNFDGQLIEIIGTDGSRLVYEVEENTDDGSRFIKYTKYVTNGANESVEEILKIDSRNTYQRKFIDKDGKEELIQYDRDINVVTHRSIKGDYVFAEYDDNGLLKSYVIPETKTELLTNSSFDNANALNIKPWTKVNKDFIKSQPSTLGDGKMVVFNYETKYSAILRQDCKIDGYTFKADQTYVAGAWAKLKNVYPSGERGLKINIYPMYDEDTGFVSEPVATVSYDTCAPDEWQYMLVAFKLEQAALQLCFSIEHIDQIGEVCVDEATLYEAANVAVDLPNIIETSPYTITKNTDGTISSEVFSDGEISFVKSYEYENNQIASITDFNGITTYYNYDANTGLLKSQGTIKGEDGIIINPTEFIYDSNKRLTEIKQVVMNISSTNDVTMTTQYGYNDNNQIESVTHNGITYVFEYNNDEILSVDMESSSYTKGENEAKLIEYDYNESGNIGEINYKNGLNIVYTYTDDKIAEIDYKVNNVLVKRYTYTYNGDNVSSVTDTQSNIKVIYTIDGYELYRITGDNLVLMYKQTKNIDGSVVETYMPDYYSVDGVPKSIVTTSADTVVTDEETAHETKTSTVSMSKITDWNSEEDYDEKNLAYTRRSISDYFGRVYQSSIEMQTVNSNNEKGKITEAYTYDELSSGVESTRVITYSTNLEMVSDDSETNRIVFSSEIFYEYDSNGNITFVYSKDSADNINPIAYYQYDEANQIVGELNYDKEISVTYTYDVGGNLTSKTNHNMSEAIVDTVAKKVTNYGAVTDVISYGYDDVWKDRLTNYNGTTISYDASGNPLNFAGKTFKVISESTIPEEIMQNNENISANLEWMGKYLTAFETDEYRYEYTYDENGYRTKKTCFDKVLNDSNEYIYELETEIIYVWDNGVLRSIINNSNTTEPMRSDIIYDQDGNMSGFFSNLGGTFFFIKDNNGSVRKLIDETGVVVASFDYDAWGQMKVTIHVDTSTISGQMGYLVYAMIVVLNPVAYNGYLFDYESGLYFSKDKVYSPTWGRYLNPVDADILKEKTQNANASNLYVFCNNNPVNIIESNSAWNRRDKGLKFVTNGFKVNMNEIFLSRPFCVVFANQIIKEYGSFDVNNGYLYKGMDTLDIASSLFAHSVGKYAQSSINKVNATWGDGWILNNSKSNTIVVVNDETLMWKYLKIWYAASEIKTYAWSNGIYITL